MASPDISIITPAFQAARFLPCALQSVREQVGVDVEHIVIDGGSTDGTRELLQDAPGIVWRSEPDRGQAHAFNKGLQLARAPLIGWLNADDRLTPGALRQVVEFFREHPEAQLLNCSLERIDADGRVVEFLPARSQPFWLRHFWFRWYGLNHPSTFYRRELFELVGAVDESLHYAMDYDFYLRASRVVPFHDLDVITTRMLVHPASKTSAGWTPFARDVRRSLAKVWWPRHPCYYWYSLVGVAMHESRFWLVESFQSQRAGRHREMLTQWGRAVRCFPPLPLLPAFYPWLMRVALRCLLGERYYARWISRSTAR